MKMPDNWDDFRVLDDAALAAIARRHIPGDDVKANALAFELRDVQSLLIGHTLGVLHRKP